MNGHLTPEEFVDALDAPPAPARARHLAECDRCGGQFAELRQAAGGARLAGDVPEPSPLFWDHLSARVRAAVGAESAPQRWWWPFGWRAAAVLAVPIVALLAVAVRQADDSGSGPAAVTTSVSSADDDLPDFVASGLSFEDSIVAQLTPEQRLELERLLQAENGSLE